MFLRSVIIFGLTAQFWTVTSEELTSTNVSQLLLAYENYINASLSLDKSDRLLLQTWTTEFLVKQVNITVQHRLEITKYQHHNFKGKKNNSKWKDCISLHKDEIDDCKTSYLDSERECLKTANSADTVKMQAVRQLEKEIRKWRKSYRYLSKLCTSTNPDDQDAASLCLVEYVKRDNFDVVFQRLIILKLEAMGNVLQEINRALWNLEDCLQSSLLTFLGALRDAMVTLSECYSRTNRE